MSEEHKSEDENDDTKINTDIFDAFDRGIVEGKALEKTKVIIASLASAFIAALSRLVLPAANPEKFDLADAALGLSLGLAAIGLVELVTLVVLEAKSRK